MDRDRAAQSVTRYGYAGADATDGDDSRFDGATTPAASDGIIVTRWRKVQDENPRIVSRYRSTRPLAVPDVR